MPFWKRKVQDSTTPPSVILRCSFCKKAETDVAVLIKGPDVCICDECVDICLDVIHDQKVKAEAEIGGRDKPS